MAPGTSRPWMVSWSSGLDLKTCSPSFSGSPTLFLRKGFISRFLAVLTSSGRSCFLKLHEAVGCSLPHYSPQSLHGLEVAKARTVVGRKDLELGQAALSLFPCRAAPSSFQVGGRCGAVWGEERSAVQDAFHLWLGTVAWNSQASLEQGFSVDVLLTCGVA